MDTPKAIPSGRKKRPSIPSRNISGRNARTMMAVANTIAGRISLLASRITVRRGCLSDSGLAAFSLRRRKTFSTSMMASSTKLPTAMARPPRVITLMVMFIQSKTSKPTARDSGIAVSVITVVLMLNRNRIRMTDTMMAASRRACTTLDTDRLMKSAWRKI